MYYLYQHTRLDKNEVFYVGIGTVTPIHRLECNTIQCKYLRAFARVKSRNPHWINIANKTEFTVNIILETENIEEIKRKEKEYIALYKPTLCNLTEGGGGIEGYNHTEETKLKISRTLTGKKYPKERVDKSNKRKYKKIIMFTDEIEVTCDSITEAAEFLGNIRYLKNISNCLRGQRPTAYGFKFKYDNENVELQDKELVG